MKIDRRERSSPEDLVVVVFLNFSEIFMEGFA
jgi:hypothetical protein